MAESTNDLVLLKRMLDAVEAYRAGSITLADLTDAIDAHYWPLLHKPDDWRRRLRSQWVVLEEVQMVTLFHDGQIDGYCRALIDRTMPSLASLINDALQSAQGSPSDASA
jgi:hypothetical protein